MTEPIIIKIGIGIAVLIMGGINLRILWDWLKGLQNVKEISELKKINENLRTELTEIRKIIVGNGDPNKSLIVRITKIEEFINELKKPQDYRIL